MAGEDVFDGQITRLVRSLYAGVKPDILTVTSRRPEEYKRILGLDKAPPKTGARVLDIGGGRSQIKAEDFGLQHGNLVRVDLDPQNPDIQQGNILQLPFKDGEFEEAWAMFILKYVDSRLPLEVDRKIHAVAESTGIGWSKYTLQKNVATFLGLKGMGEMLRVVKPGDGKVRIGSRAYDFKQSESLPTLLTGILNNRLPGLKLSGTEVESYVDDPEEREINLFLERGTAYKPEDYSSFLQQEFNRLIPQEFAQSVIK